jgi:hypothetical protein
MPPPRGDLPGLWRGASPTGSGISPALWGMSRPRLLEVPHSAHTQRTLAIKNETRHFVYVTLCLRDTTRPSESTCCAAVAAARAALVPGGEARTSEPHREARRGEARGGQSLPQTAVCAAVWRALRPSRRAAEARTARAARAMREAAEPANLRHGKERGRGVRKQGAEARRCGVLEAPARESTRRLS